MPEAALLNPGRFGGVRSVSIFFTLSTASPEGDGFLHPAAGTAGAAAKKGHPRRAGMRKVGFGVLGMGIGLLHAQQVADLPNAYLAAACDADAARLDRLGDLRCTRYTDYDAMLADPQVEVVSICAPNHLHAELGARAARAGKHVIVEKPIETTLEKADALIAACRAARVKLGVISQLRFCPASQKVKHALDQGVLGRPLLGDVYMKFYRPQEYYDQATWRGTRAGDGGGCLINQGIHGLDLLLWMMGPLACVDGFAETLARRIEVEDTAVAVCKFSGGAIGVIEATTSVWPDLHLRLAFHGDKGTIILGGTELLYVVKWRTLDSPDDASSDEAEPEIVGGWAGPFRQGWLHRAQLADMADAVLHDRAPAVTGEDGRRVLEAIHAIYRASDTGQRVTLPLR
jgi:predicted dehydrogenase